jgi:hypothetical protein
MKVCVICGLDMTCVKTGAVLHYGNGHCYAADIFACPKCNATVAVTGDTPCQLDHNQRALAKSRLGVNFIEIPQ